jgi:cytochrome o ubiquinol oxidase subunit III
MSKHSPESRISFGLWTYLLSDCMLFASLFAAYAVLYSETAGGPIASELFSPGLALTETLILLTSSFTCGLAVLAARARYTFGIWLSLLTTILLGAAFLVLEITEFKHLIHEGYGPQTSAFLSSYFTLVGTHGLHIAAGLIWAIVLGVHLLLRPHEPGTLRGLTYFSLFWHFLDIIWIYIFSIVYLFPLI